MKEVASRGHRSVKNNWIKDDQIKGNFLEEIDFNMSMQRKQQVAAQCSEEYNLAGHLEFVRRCAAGVFSSLIVCQIQACVTKYISQNSAANIVSYKSYQIIHIRPGSLSFVCIFAL